MRSCDQMSPNLSIFNLNIIHATKDTKTTQSQQQQRSNNGGIKSYGSIDL
jgi:hypothetical protein